MLKDGADYWMTFSSFQSYPGAVIWHFGSAEHFVVRNGFVLQLGNVNSTSGFGKCS